MNNNDLPQEESYMKRTRGASAIFLTELKTSVPEMGNMDIETVMAQAEEMELVLMAIQNLFLGYDLVKVLQKMVQLSTEYPDLVSEIKEQLDDE
jgi:hypothetical protein